MSRLAHWCARRRFVVVVAWITVLVGLAGAVGVSGSAFAEVQDLPDSESAAAYALLAEIGAGTEGVERGTVVWRADGAAVDDPAVVAPVTRMLDELAALPGVVQVASPYVGDGAARIDAAATTAHATVSVTTDADLDAVRDVVASLEVSPRIDVEVALGGQVFTEQPEAGGPTELIGVAIALALLLLMFRSAWAAALPVVTGVVGVVGSLLLVMLASHVVDLPDTSITMGALLGLAVGIDYALFIVNRHRKALLAGASLNDAIARAVDTSGRAVVFAGLTVVVALVGMIVVGLPVLTAMGQAAAVTVLFTVAAALTLLPALLAVIGQRVLSSRQRAALLVGESSLAAGSGGVAGRWSALVGRHPFPAALGALALLAPLALPALDIRVGNADSSSDPAGSPGREYHDLIAPAFGDGFDATLVLAAEIPDEAAVDAYNSLLAGLPNVAGVAAVAGAPAATGQPVAVVAVTPTTSAQTVETEQLVERLRSEVIPAAAAGTPLRVYVGGETATNLDVSAALLDRLPLYLGLVALLGFALLVVAFRSLIVPFVGAVTNLASMAVGLGVITAVFQWGWGTVPLGVGEAAPIMFIVPILLVGISFGLSMDYQVFLVSRMHEEWTHRGDNHRAVRVGHRETTQVIAVAASIMLGVFASFGFSGERIIASIGIGLASAVVADAFVIRLLLMPAVLHLIGARSWAYPSWLDRITPHLSVEGEPEPDGGPPPRPVIDLVDGSPLRHRDPATSAGTSVRS